MKRLLVLLLVTSPLFAENLLTNQPGTALVSGDWVNVSSTAVGLAGSKFPFYLTGWDASFYVPGIDASCSLESYWEPSSEPNRSWECYSYTENRWWMVDMGGSWHDETHPEGGHPMGITRVDPTTSVSLGACCYSGAQVSEQVHWGMWRYDFVANVGIPQMSPNSLTYQNELGTAAYDTFDQQLIGDGGDSASQGMFIYDNNQLHTSGCGTLSNYGFNCFNSWNSGYLGYSGTAPPASIEMNAIALNTADKKLYVFGGFYSGGTQNAVFTYTPSTNTWAQVTYTCHDALGGSNCPVGRIIPGWAYDANENIFLMHGGMASGAPKAAVLNDTWAFDPVAVTFTQIPTMHAPIYDGIQSATTASMGIGDITLTLTAAGNFSAPAVLYIDSEAIYCTTLASASYSGCTRGYENTVPATHLSGATVISSITPVGPNERLVWMPEDDVFTLSVDQGTGTGPCPGESPQCAQMWAFRYTPGGHTGYRSATYTPTQLGSIGPLNRNEAGFTTSQLQTNQSYAMGSAVASSGSTVYQLWTETDIAQVGGNSAVSHPYANSNTGGTSTNLGSSYNSIALDEAFGSGTGSMEGFDPSLTVVGSTPWACWDQQNINIPGHVECKSWTGTTWATGGPIYPFMTIANLPSSPVQGQIVTLTNSNDCSTTVGTATWTNCRWTGSAWTTGLFYDAFAKAINVGGTPTILYREQDRNTGVTPTPTYAFVTQWNGSTFTPPLGQHILNNNLTHYTVTGATSATSAVFTTTGPPATASSVIFAGFTGTSWSSLNGLVCNVASTTTTTFTCSSINTSGFPAYNQGTNAGTATYYWYNVDSADISTDGTNIYVATSEYKATNSGAAPTNGVVFTAPGIYLYEWNGSAWSMPCSASANVTSTDRAFNVATTTLGGVPYVSFVERSDVGSIQKLFVRKCSGGAWSTVGSGTLNRDTLAGWAFRAELTNDGTNLYATWVEQGNPQPWVGTLSLASHYNQVPHVYVAKWNGTAWSSMGGALNADPAYGAATQPAITIAGGNPVVQWGERSSHNLRQIYAKQWSGTEWGPLTTVHQLSATGGVIISRVALQKATIR